MVYLILGLIILVCVLNLISTNVAYKHQVRRFKILESECSFLKRRLESVDAEKDVYKILLIKTQNELTEARKQLEGIA